MPLPRSPGSSSARLIGGNTAPISSPDAPVLEQPVIRPSESLPDFASESAAPAMAPLEFNPVLSPNPVTSSDPAVSTLNQSQPTQHQQISSRAAPTPPSSLAPASPEFPELPPLPDLMAGTDSSNPQSFETNPLESLFVALLVGYHLLLSLLLFLACCFQKRSFHQ